MAFDNLDDLRVLLATADTGSLTAAGRRCGLSTAAVSAALKRLESALGARLFDRTTRSVRPTAEGEVMIDHARRALDLVAEGQAKVRGDRGELVGTINVTASSSMSQRLLAGWLGEFAAAHPGLEIDLQVSDSWLDLVKDGVDVALQWARQGRGVVYLSEIDLHEPVRRGEMRRLFPAFDGEAAPLYAVLPSARFTPHRVKVMVDALAAWFSARAAGAFEEHRKTRVHNAL